MLASGDRAAVTWAPAYPEGPGLANIRAEKVTVPGWERGEIEGTIVAAFPQPMALTAPCGWSSTKVRPVREGTPWLTLVKHVRPVQPEVTHGVLLTWIGIGSARHKDLLRCHYLRPRGRPQGRRHAPLS